MIENLIGRIVTLDTKGTPEIIKNWIGTPALVESIDRSRMLVLIIFADDTQCEVHPKHLIMLKQQSDIVRKVTLNWNISPADFQTITKVSALMLKGALVDALTLALSSATTKEYCTINCSDWLSNKNNKTSRKRRRPM